MSDANQDQWSAARYSPAARYARAADLLVHWPGPLTLHQVGTRQSRRDPTKTLYVIELEFAPMPNPTTPVFGPQFFAQLLPALSPALASFGGALIGQLAPGNAQIQADAQQLVGDALKLAVDVIAVKAAAAPAPVKAA